MKLIVRLFVVALVCLSGTTVDAQNYNSVLKAQKPKTDAKGYYSLLDCPQSLPNVEVITEQNDNGSYAVRVLIKGKQVDTFTCESTSDDVRFVDANFDGYYDIFIGPATTRNYSHLYLWDTKKQWFYHATSPDNLNDHFILNPAKKQWVSAGSSSYCSMYYTIFRWDDDKVVDIESLIDISDPTAHHEYGVKRRYTVIKGGDFENIAPNRKLHTNRKSALPKKWRTILKEFDKYIQ